MDRLQTFRARWRDRLKQVLGERDGSILSAILLGEKQGVDPEVKELYQTKGIGHVLAISGLHLSFLGLGVYRLLCRLTGSITSSGVAGMLFLGLYVLMIGFTVSALRALIMFLFRIGADLTGRHYDGPTALRSAYGLILAGRHNRYGHPHAETLKRLEAAGCEICSTQEAGALTITVTKGGHQFRVEKYIQ